jgi:hypothetical protein
VILREPVAGLDWRNHGVGAASRCTRRRKNSDALFDSVSPQLEPAGAEPEVSLPRGASRERTVDRHRAGASLKCTRAGRYAARDLSQSNGFGAFVGFRA